MGRFDNRNVLITGAASGMGRAACFRIASEGGNLALIDINIDQLKLVAEEIKQSYSVNVVYAQSDVGMFEQTQAVIDQLVSKIGGIQALSHNAGILRCYHTHEMTLEQWTELMNINLTGTFNVNRHALPHLLKNERSYLVNASSLAAQHPHPWVAGYSATKGAIKSFTRSLSIEYRSQGLRANCIMPGSIGTELANTFEVPQGGDETLLKTINPLEVNQLGSPDKAAGIIAMLTSEDAYYINGTEITFDAISVV